MTDCTAWLDDKKVKIKKGNFEGNSTFRIPRREKTGFSKRKIGEDLWSVDALEDIFVHPNEIFIHSPTFTTHTLHTVSLERE